MSRDLEDRLRHELRSQAAGFDLAPGAVATAAARGSRRARRTRASVGGGLVVVIALAATAVHARSDRKPTSSVVVSAAGQTPATPGGVHQLITRSTDDRFPGLFASLSGTLVVTPNNCVAVAPGDGGQPVGVVWGNGWSATTEADKAVVRSATGAVFAREGEHVSLGGGGISTSAAPKRYTEDPCWTNQMWEANDQQGRRLASQ